MGLVVGDVFETEKKPKLTISQGGMETGPSFWVTKVFDIYLNNGKKNLESELRSSNLSPHPATPNGHLREMQYKWD